MIRDLTVRAPCPTILQVEGRRTGFQESTTGEIDMPRDNCLHCMKCISAITEIGTGRDETLTLFVASRHSFSIIDIDPLTVTSVFLSVLLCVVRLTQP